VEPAIRGVVLLSTLLPVTADSQEKLFHYHCTWRVLNRFSLSFTFSILAYITSSSFDTGNRRSNRMHCRIQNPAQCAV